MQGGTCSHPALAAGAVPSEGSLCLGKGTSACREPNNQPIHPNDCSIEDELTRRSHNRTLQMTLFNQENRFVLFLKANESSFGCEGQAVFFSEPIKARGLRRRLKRLCLPSVSRGSYLNREQGSHSTADRAATVTKFNTFEAFPLEFSMNYFEFT